MTVQNEVEKVIDRYERRKNIKIDYSRTVTSNLLSGQEKERAIVKWINKFNIKPLDNKKLLEIGCGSGVNLLEFMLLGFMPKNIVANELIDEFVEKAKIMLPKEIDIHGGDASTLELEKESFDIVFQSLVFTSLLDDEFQQKLADKMWSLVKPGGGVLWYDFTFNNPKNPDVRGVKLKRIKELFPEAKIKTWRITLAPPIGRRVCKVSGFMYHLFNMFPFLRTHVLCWIQKKA